MIYGSQSFVAQIKEQYLNNSKEVELPQHNSMFREFEPEVLLLTASEILGFDMASARTSKKVDPLNKDDRDLLIYSLWQSGRLSNHAIGDYFGITYSAVSRRVKIITDRLQSDIELKKKYNWLKSKINSG